MDCTPDMQERIDKELTYLIPSHNPTDPPQVIANMGIIRNGLISIPIGRTDLIPRGYEIKDKRNLVPVDFPKFKYDLRPSQQKVYDEIEDNAIINAWVSWGKTFTGLAIAGKLGQKTLIVTHTVPLRNQWVKEVEKVFEICSGILGSGNWDSSGPIVVGNTQTLYRNVEKIKKTFGTIILDEMHHVSSPTFSRIIDSSFARYKIGLSGTIERKDGKHVVFRDYFGHNVIKPPKENYLVPKIDILKTEIRFLDGSYTPWAERINHLTMDAEYVHGVAATAARYAAEGHKVLVVSDRVKFLKSCAALVGDKAVSITGDMDFAERERTMQKIKNEKQILFGTQSIFSEGISINELSCLVLGTPVNNDPLLTQLIGRIIRKVDGKKQPVVVDFNLKGKTAARQASARMGYYMKQGYEVNVL